MNNYKIKFRLFSKISIKIYREIVNITDRYKIMLLVS